MRPLPANDSTHGLWKPNPEQVEKACFALLESLGIDQTVDHNTKGTASRMSKMYCAQVFRGRYSPPPAITTFPNVNKLDELVVTGPISVRSTCSHHFCPILGRCWIGVVYGDRLAGLSKFNRIVDWFARRPQIQEELVIQIADFIEEALSPKGLAIMMSATHTCMTWRGVEESPDALMTTNVMRGVFRTKPEARSEFMAVVAGHR